MKENALAKSYSTSGPLSEGNAIKLSAKGSQTLASLSEGGGPR